MIESVQFRNFKTLRDTRLPLSRLTLIVGPNGSGKSTALQALLAAGRRVELDFQRTASAGLHVDKSTTVQVVVRWGEPSEGDMTLVTWSSGARIKYHHTNFKKTLAPEEIQDLQSKRLRVLSEIQIYSFDAAAICSPRLSIQS